MTKKKYLLFLTAVFLLLLWEVISLLTIPKQQPNLRIFTFKEIEPTLSLPEISMLKKIQQHLQKHSPLPFYIAIVSDSIEEKKITSLYNTWNNQLQEWKDYGIFLVCQLKKGKIYFIPGKKLILRLNNKKIQSYIHKIFPREIKEKTFPDALNNLINFIYEELKPNLSFLKNKLSLFHKEEGQLEKIPLKWYFFIGLIITIALLLFVFIKKHKKRAQKLHHIDWPLSKRARKLLQKSFIQKNWK